MQILGNLFNIIVFVGVIGSFFTVVLLFLQKGLHVTLPLWVGMLGAVFYLTPIAVPQVKLISPEEVFWIRAYEIASIIWIIGAAVFVACYLLRGLFAYRAIRGYAVCKDERLSRIYSKCANELNIKSRPSLLLGTLKEPACVVTVFHPAVILNRDIALQLSDNELQVVLCHELTHIKRKHHFAQRIYDFVSALYWFNPLVWIAKHEFSHICEMDCDSHTLKLLLPQTTVKEYTSVMLRLLELSAKTGNNGFGKIGALSFLLAKQRFINILHRPSKIITVAMLLVVMLCTVLTVALSAAVSRTMFYPYPAYSNGTLEYTETGVE